LIKVGDKNPITKKPYNYGDIKMDCDGWVDAKEYLPPDFELCLLKTPNRTLAGWHMRNGWDGHRMTKQDEIQYWKRKLEQD